MRWRSPGSHWIFGTIVLLAIAGASIRSWRDRPPGPPVPWDADVRNSLDAQEYIARGHQRHANGELDGALREFAESIRLDSQQALPYHLRGRVWHEKGNDEKAIADFDEAIRLNPREPTAYINRGISWNARKNSERALADFDEAIRQDPKAAESYFYRAYFWQSQNELDKSLADYDEAIRLNPQYADAFYNRGCVWYSRKHPGEALADFNESIRLNPGKVETYWGRSGLLVAVTDAEIRNEELAVDDAKKACELTAWKDWSALSFLANIYAEIGQFKMAVEWMQKAIDVAPDPHQAKLRLSLESYKAGKRLQAGDANKPAK